MKRDILKVKRKVGLNDKKYYSEYSGRKGYKPSSHHYALTSSEDTKMEHRIARRHLNKTALYCVHYGSHGKIGVTNAEDT